MGGQEATRESCGAIPVVVHMPLANLCGASHLFYRKYAERKYPHPECAVGFNPHTPYLLRNMRRDRDETNARQCTKQYTEYG